MLENYSLPNEEAIRWLRPSTFGGGAGLLNMEPGVEYLQPIRIRKASDFSKIIMYGQYFGSGIKIAFTLRPSDENGEPTSEINLLGIFSVAGSSSFRQEVFNAEFNIPQGLWYLGVIFFIPDGAINVWAQVREGEMRNPGLIKITEDNFSENMSNDSCYTLDWGFEDYEGQTAPTQKPIPTYGERAPYFLVGSIKTPEPDIFG